MDNPRIVAAEAIATILLDGCTDKHGEPLIDHCRRVYERCRDAGLSEDQQIAAWLHDVVEQLADPFKRTERFDLIRVLFGVDVFYTVDTLTRPHDISYEQYIWRLSSRSEAIPIKLADIDDNFNRSPVPGDLKRRYEVANAFLLEAMSKNV